MRPNSFYDEDGLLHVHRGKSSENGPLFTAEYYMLTKLTGQVTNMFIPISPIVKAIVKEGWFNPFPSDDNAPDVHFSHDNMTGLYSLYYLAGIKNDLPVLKWNDRWWLHPRDIAFYNLMKMEGELLWINLPIQLLALGFVLAASFVSSLSKRSRTSGKMMWWLRLQILQKSQSKLVSLISKGIWTLCGVLLKKEHGKKPMIDISAIYFKDQDHPVNELMREHYGNI